MGEIRRRGGLAWWNPDLKKGDGCWKPFSSFQISYMTSAENGKLIVISTKAVLDVHLGKPKPEEGRLFVFDTNKKEIIREIEPIAKADNTGMVVGVGGSRILGMTHDPDNPNQSTLLYGVDILNGLIVFRKKIPYPLGVQIDSNQREPFDYRVGPDGWVWTFIDKCLVRINPDNALIEVLGRVRRGGRLAFSGKDIYLANDKSLRKIEGILFADDTEGQGF